MDNKIEVFKNEQFGEIRTALIENEPWFVAVDVCRALEIGNSSQAISRLDADEKMITLISNEGNKRGNPNMTVVNEPGLYTLILSSRKPEAKAFKRWITHDVIPMIRKTGCYMTDSVLERIRKDPTFTYTLAKAMLREKDRADALEAELNAAKPKADYYDTFINPDDCTNIRTTAKELKIPERKFVKFLLNEGYLVRHRGRDSKGRLVTTEFDIYESPQAGLPHREKPHRENPDVDSPDVENPHRDNPAQINTIQVTNQGRNTLSKNYQSINLDGMDRMDERSEYEEIIKDNLDYDILCLDPKFDKDRFREIMDIMLDAVCSTAPTIRINGEDMPQQVVKSRFLKLNSSHIEYVLEAMNKNPSDIRNIRAYLLTALYNASLTIDNYYSALVNHDFYGQDRSTGSKKPKTYDYSLSLVLPLLRTSGKDKL